MVAFEDLSGILRWFHPDDIRQLEVKPNGTTIVRIRAPNGRNVDIETYETRRRASDIAHDWLWRRANPQPQSLRALLELQEISDRDPDIPLF